MEAISDIKTDAIFLTKGSTNLSQSNMSNCEE